MTKKSKNGTGKFFLGALLGGVAGAIAGKLFRQHEAEIKENVNQKVDDLADKFNHLKEKEEIVSDEAKKVKQTAASSAKKVTKTAAAEAKKVGKSVEAGVEKVEKTAKNA